MGRKEEILEHLVLCDLSFDSNNIFKDGAESSEEPVCQHSECDCKYVTEVDFNGADEVERGIDGIVAGLESLRVESE